MLGAAVGSAYGSPDQLRFIHQYREDRGRLLLFHVDTQTYRVAEILPHIQATIATKQEAVDSTNQALSFITEEIIQRQGRYSGPRAPGVRKDFTQRIEAINERLAGLQRDIRQLESARRSFARNRRADYEKLEKEGVLYGHEDVVDTSAHRTVPHINVEGPSRPRNESRGDEGFRRRHNLHLEWHMNRRLRQEIEVRRQPRASSHCHAGVRRRAGTRELVDSDSPARGQQVLPAGGTLLSDGSFWHDD